MVRWLKDMKEYIDEVLLLSIYIIILSELSFCQILINCMDVYSLQQFMNENEIKQGKKTN